MVPNSIIAPSDEVGETYAKPDLSQMIPFKPRRFPTPGSHPVAGGEYPMPEGLPINLRFFDDISTSRTNSNRTYRYVKYLRLSATNRLFMFN